MILGHHGGELSLAQAALASAATAPVLLLALRTELGLLAKRLRRRPRGRRSEQLPKGPPA